MAVPIIAVIAGWYSKAEKIGDGEPIRVVALDVEVRFLGNGLV